MWAGIVSVTDVHRRKADLLTGKEDLELVYKIQNLPAFMGTTLAPKQDDILLDLEIMISRSSGLPQVGKLLPLSTLYSSGHGAGTTGATWLKHHEMFADFVLEEDASHILEIGGGSGILSDLCAAKSADFDCWLILDPDETVDQSRDKRIMRRFDFFDTSTAPRKGEVHQIVHSHFFEHVYDPISFMQLCSSILTAGSAITFSVPNMRYMLEQQYTNCLMFEHTYLLDELYIEEICRHTGFEITRMYNFGDHSIFYSCVKIREPTAGYIDTCPRFKGLYKKNKYLLEAVNDGLQHTVSVLLEELKLRTGSPIYLFGAHIFSQVLLAAGLPESAVVSVLDNDRGKWGQRLYGTSLKVEPPRVLSEKDNPTVFLFAGGYSEEIKREIETSVKSNVNFVTSADIT